MGHGGIKESQIVNRIYEEYQKDHVVPVTDEDIIASVGEEGVQKPLSARHHSKSGIVVKGLYDVAVHFSKCCNPVPGDEIVGFVTRGRGVSIHRTDCINIINLNEIEKDRLIEAEWQAGAEERLGSYLAEIKIFCNDRPGLLVDISKIFTEKDVNINSINSRTSKQGIATIEVTFETRNREELSALVEKLRQIDHVIEIQRTTG